MIDIVLTIGRFLPTGHEFSIRKVMDTEAAFWVSSNNPSYRIDATYQDFIHEPLIIGQANTSFVNHITIEEDIQRFKLSPKLLLMTESMASAKEAAVQGKGVLLGTKHDGGLRDELECFPFGNHEELILIWNPKSEKAGLAAAIEQIIRSSDL